MPAKEISELRKAGRLEAALSLARSELLNAEANLELVEESNTIVRNMAIKAINESKLIWPKRNISWVYYEYLKQNTSSEQFDSFIIWLNEIKNLHLPLEEKMLFEQLCWQVGKMAFSLIKNIPQDHDKGIRLFEAINTFHFPKPSEGYSFLFKALHKLLKETNYYIKFADWWNFENFAPEDFQKEQMPNGREVMAIAEQAYIAYAKHLLPKYLTDGGILSGEISFDVDKVRDFLPKLKALGNSYPDFQYPGYFEAKLHLALGDTNKLLDTLLPFAKKKQNDFWVWEILAEAFSNDPEKVFACYCKALTCKSPEEMLVSLRQKMVTELKQRGFFSEAKTEIELLTNTRTKNGYKIPDEVKNWQNEDWYKNSIAKKDNLSFYKQYVQIAEEILFNDIAEELVFVEFVNRDKKVLNFIASEKKYGFFKYNHLNLYPQVGEVLKVRFLGGSVGSIYKVCSALKVDNHVFKENFEKIVSGVVRINEGNNFGFIKDYYIHPDFVSKHQLKNGDEITATIIKSFNKSKSTWGWRVLTIK
jgi:hypothetical protein